MARALKVFCTPIGFHDAYVAAPSQKAALKAWGSDADLFARGMASVVSDPKLMKEPLANPGKVIKRARGSAAQHLAALPKTSKSSVKQGSPGARLDTQAVKLKPRPSRRDLDAAEMAVDHAERKYDKADEAIRVREEALRRERHELHSKRDEEITKLQRALERVRSEYERALDAWRV